jgi:UDP-glucuronate decarboxylase
LDGPINLGNPKEFSVRELAELVLKITASRSRLEPHPLPNDDPKVRQPDIARARELLDWQPRVELREGLESTIADFESRRSASRK